MMKTRILKIKEKSPIITGIVSALVWIAVLLAVSTAFSFVLNLWEGGVTFATTGYNLQFVMELVVALLSMGFTALYGYTGIYREKRKSFVKGVWTGGYFLAIGIFSLIVMTAGADRSNVEPAVSILIFTLTMLLIGVAEEFMFRGVVSNMIYDKYAKDTAGVWFACIVSGLIFGCIHMTNVIGSGIPIGGVFVQAVVASAMGMVLTAIYYRTRNIWIVVFIHGFIDFASLSASGLFGQGDLQSTIGSYSMFQVIGVIPYVLVLLVLLRGSKVREMLGEHMQPSTPQSRKRLTILAIVLGIIFAILLVFGVIDMVQMVVEEMNTMMQQSTAYLSV